MAESPYIIEATLENFPAEVLEKSMQVPVLVDFWADWCAPCKQLMPILEKLATEYQGAFILAKVNADQQQELASHLGVRSLPTVKLVHQGKLAGEFSGAQPESKVRELLSRYIQSPGAELRDQARTLVEQGQAEQALAMLTQANQADPNNMEILVDIAAVKVALGEKDEAAAILSSLPADIQGRPDVKQLLARIRFVEKAGAIAPLADIQQRLQSNAADSEARFQLALHAIMNNKFEDAVEALLNLMQTDRSYGDDAARKTLIELFDMLGAAHPLVRTYRRKLYALLH
ncbi:tetratricopeptide repeat protein [Hahella sp. KA22]|uniref:thioredoxin family protein n=1 Tax=Hahella sp. KA22 TaxID=1628392 RepID=UPI000FDD946D|nr:co-chaperone YbbN [Hahella sp. KA22]AZZ94185.1 co-chaperone YbbN [Hahella sp. KA22]QAY57559.1 tetratricopeptide repeat protein [Hahella sp. KA22]